MASVALIGLAYGVFNGSSGKSYTNQNSNNPTNQTRRVTETKKQLEVPTETQKPSQSQQSVSSPQQSSATQSAGPSSYLSSNSNPTPTCNAQLKASYDSKKAADMAYEETKHNSYNPPAPRDSSDWGNLMDIENARHNAAVATIESDYQAKLSSIYCS